MLLQKDDVVQAIPTKSDANLIRWNLDMNVTVSNVKHSKIFLKPYTLFVIILTVLFIVIISFQRMEIQALQIQIASKYIAKPAYTDLLSGFVSNFALRSMYAGFAIKTQAYCGHRWHRICLEFLSEFDANLVTICYQIVYWMNHTKINILQLMSKYDRLNRSINQIMLHYDSIESIESFIRNFSNLPEIHRNDHDINATSLTSYSDQTLTSNQSINHQNNVTKKDINTILDVTTSMKTKSNLIVDLNKKRGLLRNPRALLTLEAQNHTIKAKNSSDDASNSWREPRARRLRRDEGRGKKRRQNRRRPKRSCGRLGPLVATFIGAVPEQHITDAVYIGPWIKSDRNDNQCSFTKFHLVEDKKSIEVTASGLYMISVQIFYFGEPTNYSYWVLLSSEGMSTTQRLTKCATASSNMAGEISCYTSIIAYLQKGDRLRIQQQEKDRYINMREGYSYIQVVLLSNKDTYRKQST